MVTTAKTISQVATHMGIAFGIMYASTGSVALGGLAALLEPIINVALLPVHERVWHRLRHIAGSAAPQSLMLAAQKLSQTGLHMAVAFGTLYWATGSLVAGGLAAVLEPICNVILLPFHDRAWENLRARLERNDVRSFTAG